MLLVGACRAAALGPGWVLLGTVLQPPAGGLGWLHRARVGFVVEGPSGSAASARGAGHSSPCGLNQTRRSYGESYRLQTWVLNCTYLFISPIGVIGR